MCACVAGGDLKVRIVGARGLVSLDGLQHLYAKVGPAWAWLSVCTYVCMGVCTVCVHWSVFGCLWVCVGTRGMYQCSLVMAFIVRA